MYRRRKWRYEGRIDTSTRDAFEASGKVRGWKRKKESRKGRIAKGGGRDEERKEKKKKTMKRKEKRQEAWYAGSGPPHHKTGLYTPVTGCSGDIKFKATK